MCPRYGSNSTVMRPSPGRILGIETSEEGEGEDGDGEDMVGWKNIRCSISSSPSREPLDGYGAANHSDLRNIMLVVTQTKKNNRRKGGQLLT